MDKKETKRKIDLMNIDELREVSGGWAGKGKYTFEEYLRAGIIWRHYWVGKDKYCDRDGNVLTEAQADLLTDRYTLGKREVSREEYDDYMNWKRGQRIVLD